MRSLPTSRWAAGTVLTLSVVMTVAGRAQTTDTTRQSPTAHAAISWAVQSNFSGPRFGVTVLPSAAVDTLAQHGIKVGSVVSQFGWQFEREFYSGDSGLMALNEWVFLVGGLDRSEFLPSASWLVGIRGRSGFEAGIGPNVTPLGVSLALAGGVTLHRSGMNFPLNVALVSSKTGLRMSLLTGFTLH